MRDRFSEQTQKHREERITLSRTIDARFDGDAAKRPIGGPATQALAVEPNSSASLCLLWSICFSELSVNEPSRCNTAYLYLQRVIDRKRLAAPGFDRGPRLRRRRPEFVGC